jgi:uncharacterized membrane protein YqgA involved in biofilm formation
MMGWLWVLWPSGVNALTVLVGGWLGWCGRSHLPRALLQCWLQGLGVFLLTLGMGLALPTRSPLLLVGSLLLGVALGEGLGLETRLQSWLGRRCAGVAAGLSQGFLLFCVGAMTLLGSFEAGLGQFPVILLQKALIDGVAALLLGSTLGMGVAWAAVPLFCYQGMLTLVAYGWGQEIPEAVVREVNALGGLLLLATGLDLLEIKKIPVVNFLPAFLVQGLWLAWRGAGP